jgi:ketosteroid isomerase-like protein
MSNEQIITTFYTAFQQQDYKTMQSLYADTATFSDAVFRNLDAQEVRAMWQMLITRGKDFELTFKDVVDHGQTTTATWVATYSFSATGRKVTNLIHATFEIGNGKIVKHTDQFSFYKWARQALGLPGLLLGWSPLIKNKIRKTARQNLTGFMQTAKG